ncbi:jasmonate-induced oxygenase 4-like isoform X2 [Apium graveolens]|uniref:jasmonate-induced oxygenase 4-like isoform X2 n=1 Tax=Apium graveolens TaxID=4045 RepID=UPI003D7AB9AF
MAEAHESVVLLKPVQELAVDCNTPPQRYIHKRGDEDIGVNSPVIDVAVIDLDSMQSSSPSAEQELEKLRTSLASCGCFQVIGHGMTDSFLDQVHGIGRDFFALPWSEKRKWSRTAEDTEGYGNDSELSEHQILDWTDRLYLTTNPEDQRKYQFWPQNPENFREILQEYTEKIILLNQVVLKALSKSLNLQENCFLDQYGENSNMVARFNYYPPCPRPDLSLGVKQHADGSAITFLLQDNQVDGLQVLKDDQWFSVPTVPNALLVNVGDQLEIMSNGIFKSPLHRVVTNSERERTTAAVFCCPDSSRFIEPAEDLISETSPRLYKKIKNYVGIFFENYQQGKRAIEAVKLY